MVLQLYQYESTWGSGPCFDLDRGSGWDVYNTQVRATCIIRMSIMVVNSNTDPDPDGDPDRDPTRARRPRAVEINRVREFLT